MFVKRLDMTKYDQALAASRIKSLAFHRGERYEMLQQQTEAAQKEGFCLPDPAAGDPPVSNWGVFSDDKLISVASSINYLMRYENRDVPMSGIQGVATLPEHRRCGAIRLLLRELLASERKRGSVFSYLHPFSYSYYLRFGYGYGVSRLRTTVPVALLREFEPEGSMRLAEMADLEIINRIYRQFIAGTNGPVQRGSDSWQRYLGKDPYISGCLPYIWADTSGRPEAYIILQDRGHNDVSGQRILLIHDWGCSDPRHIRPLLAFLGNFASEYAAAEILLPRHFPPDLLFSELISISQKLEPYGQIRLLNVETALSGWRKPSVLPDFTFAMLVSDDLLPANQGIYEVRTGTGGNSVRYKPASAADYDISLDISSLSSMLLGSRDLRQLLLTGKADCPAQTAEKTRQYLEFLFRGRETAIYDYF